MSNSSTNIKYITEEQANAWYSSLESTDSITIVPWKHTLEALYINELDMSHGKGRYSVVGKIQQDGIEVIPIYTIIRAYMSRLYRGLLSLRVVRGQELDTVRDEMRIYLDKFIDINASTIIATLLEANATLAEIEEVVYLSSSKILKANFNLIS